MLSRWAGLTRLQRLIRRSAAYADVFGARPELRSRSQDDVLADLGEFCRAVKPPVAGDAGGAIDVNKSMILIGRQEVFFRICEIARISPGQIHAYFDAETRATQSEGEEDKGE